MIEDNDSIILDSGTTTLQIAKHLTTQKNVTVITNDINIASVLRTNREVKTIVTGGVVYHDSYMLNGMLTDSALKNMYVNKAFIATPAFDLASGLNHFDEYLIPAKKEMLSSTQNVIVVADRSAPYKCCNPAVQTYIQSAHRRFESTFLSNCNYLAERCQMRWAQLVGPFYKITKYVLFHCYFVSFLVMGRVIILNIIKYTS